MDDGDSTFSNLASVSKNISAWFYERGKPKRIIEEAEAKRRAAIIDAETSEIRLNNIVNTLKKTEQYLSNDVEIKKIDEGWNLKFLNEVATTSDEEVQDYFARILAGELQSPGRYSKRTISLLGNLSTTEAKAFLNLVRYSVKVLDRVFIIPTIDKTTYVNFVDILSMEDCGLSTMNVGYQLVDQTQYVIEYGSRIAIMEISAASNIDLFSNSCLTQAGKELYNMLEEYGMVQFDYEFLDSYLSWSSKNNKSKGTLSMKTEPGMGIKIKEYAPEF